MSYIKTALEESREYFNSRYEKDLEKNRKADFSVTVLKDGRPIDGGELSYSLKKIDFDFGCNIFMLEQYDTAAQQETYYAQWKKLFNTAVVPFYWEGTEPKQGYLRYAADVPNDVYRRPPVDRVVQFCKENGIAMKGHPLFWQEFIARWLPEQWEELYPLIEKRFREISERYAGEIPVFDCVNEPSRLFDQLFEYRFNDWKCVFPPDDYIEQIFRLAERYFPGNELILNEATGAAICEFRGIYGGYYLLLKSLIEKGLKIDRIGLQCHVWDSDYNKNLFHSERLYRMLDTYGSLGKPLVLSEVGLSCEDEETQALAADRFYRVCFSHQSMTGIFWWNLDDNGVLCDKQRNAAGENLPYSGLVRNGKPKAAYRALDKLINGEWHTEGRTGLTGGSCDFRGFYGLYDITVTHGNTTKTVTADFTRQSDGRLTVEL